MAILNIEEMKKEASLYEFAFDGNGKAIMLNSINDLSTEDEKWMDLYEQNEIRKEMKKVLSLARIETIGGLERMFSIHVEDNPLGKPGKSRSAARKISAIVKARNQITVLINQSK